MREEVPDRAAYRTESGNISDTRLFSFSVLHHPYSPAQNISNRPCDICKIRTNYPWNHLCRNYENIGNLSFFFNTPQGHRCVSVANFQCIYVHTLTVLTKSMSQQKHIKYVYTLHVFFLHFMARELHSYANCIHRFIIITLY